MEAKPVRKKLVGGNWKCKLTHSDAQKLVSEVYAKLEYDPNKVDVVCAPNFLHLATALKGVHKDVNVCAQNCSLTGMGAFTGEISLEHLKDFGVNWTLAGHSERRAYYHDTDEVVAQKTKRALDMGFHVIACIGETLEQREANKTMEVCTRQLTAIKNALKVFDWKNVVVAYEPVWAIGTGKTASPEQAQEVHAALRKWLSANVHADVGESTRILYGGSVKDKNYEDLLQQPDIDGFLIGGASLKPQMKTIVDGTSRLC